MGNFAPIKMLDLELTSPQSDLCDLERYGAVHALVRWHGLPLGSIAVPVHDGRVTAAALHQAIAEQLHWPLRRCALLGRLGGDPTPGASLAELAAAPRPAAYPGPWPTLTVAVCTRDRPRDLARCLRALEQLDYAGELELIVVDNAPRDERAERLVCEQFPRMRYLREDRPGLNRARNRAISAARGEILAFTDDDVVVDRLWVQSLARVFAEHPGVMAVTGLVEPLELETEAQVAFERYGGFGRGYVQRWLGVNRAGGERAASEHTATARFGTGANMAFRRSVFSRIGGFDPALDVGTVSNGGGDLELFFRLLKAGFPLVYAPEALVRHGHRREYERFRTQIVNNGVGFYAYLVRCYIHFPDERLPLARYALWWFLYWFGYRLLTSFRQPINTTRRLVLAELWGALLGLGRYQQARRHAAALASSADPGCVIVDPGQTEPGLRPHGAALRSVDLSVPVGPLADVCAYPETLVLVHHGAQLSGACNIANCYQPISAGRLREAIVDQLGQQLLASEPAARRSHGCAYQLSVVVAHTGSALDLQRCLLDLQAQVRPLAEIVVVAPAHAARTLANQVAAWADVRLLHAPHPGLVCAWNTGLAAVSGPLVALLDDQTRLAPDWASQLSAPFADPAIAAVVGNLLPSEIETRAQRLAVRYAGLGRGFTPERLGQGALPAWARNGLIGVALRTAAIPPHSPGLLDERLEPGAPAGAGEDTALFTRLRAAGQGVAYAPGARAWRRPAPSLRQLSAEVATASRGQVSAGLAMLLRSGQAQPLRHALQQRVGHPVQALPARLAALLRGRDGGMLRLTLAELAGALSAPWGLLRARAAARSRGDGHGNATSAAVAPTAETAEIA